MWDCPQGHGSLAIGGKTELGGRWPSNYRGVVLPGRTGCAGQAWVIWREGRRRQENGLTHLFRTSLVYLNLAAKLAQPVQPKLP